MSVGALDKGILCFHGDGPEIFDQAADKIGGG